MDRETFNRQVEATSEALRRFLVGLCCGDVAQADDIAQETYMKAYLSCSGLRDPGSFKAWIQRIAYTTFVSYRRLDRIKKVAPDSAEALGLESGDSADAGFRYQDLYRALEKISEKERTALLLFYLDDCTAVEIGKVMDCTPENVRKMLSRGRQHLKKFL